MYVVVLLFIIFLFLSFVVRWGRRVALFVVISLSRARCWTRRRLCCWLFFWSRILWYNSLSLDDFLPSLWMPPPNDDALCRKPRRMGNQLWARTRLDSARTTNFPNKESRVKNGSVCCPRSNRRSSCRFYSRLETKPRRRRRRRRRRFLY